MKDIRIGDLDAIAPSSWAIRGVIGDLSVIWGDPGSYKTFLATSMAVSVASGEPWFGCQVRQGPVLYILGEGGVDMFRRRAGMAAKQRGLDIKDLPLYVRPEAIDMSTPSRLNPYMDQWTVNISPVLVVIDTLSRCLPGDENTQEVMQGFISCMDVMREVFGATVLALHHAGKSGEMRGSTVLHGAVDVNLRVEKDEAARRLRIEAEKLRDLDTDEFSNQALIPEKVDVRNSEGRLVLDEFGDKVQTLVFNPSQDYSKLADEIANIFTDLKEGQDRGKGEWVGYAEWYNAWASTQVQPASSQTFKNGLNHLLLRRDTDIVSVDVGQYERKALVSGTWDFQNLVTPGMNYDTSEELERELTIATLLEEVEAVDEEAL